MAKTPLIGITTSFDQGEEEPLLPGKRLLFVTTDYVEALQLQKICRQSLTT